MRGDGIPRTEHALQAANGKDGPANFNEQSLQLLQKIKPCSGYAKL
jgi:hypothetical protein